MQLVVLAFAYVAAAQARGIDDGAPAWSLFTDREAVEREMTSLVRRGVAEAHGVVLHDEPGGGAATDPERV